MEESLIDNIIWEELAHAKYWEQYISQYISHKYDYRKTYNIIILLLSTIGSISFPIWKLIPDGYSEYVPIVLLCLVAIVQIFSVCQKSYVIDDDTAQKLREFRRAYISYYNKLEPLYIDFHDGTITEKEAKNIFYKIKEDDLSLEILKDSLNIKQISKLDKKANFQVMLRLSRRLGSDMPEEKKTIFTKFKEFMKKKFSTKKSDRDNESKIDDNIQQKVGETVES